MKRNRGYYRKVRLKAINRKRKILNDIYNYDIEQPGRLNKKKIHCSCFMCSFHGTTYSDKKKFEKMQFDLEDYYENETDVPLNLLGENEKVKKKIRGNYQFKTCGIKNRQKVNQKINIEEFKKGVEYGNV